MKVLVTGGAGFIASHVTDAYIELGHHVIVVDNLSTGRMENVNPQAEFHCQDIREPDLEEIFANNKIDVINHHAAQMDVRRSVDDPIFDARVNILGFINLLQLAKKYGVRKVIFSSTGGAIYGEQDYFPADEEHPLRPISPYGISKLAGEKYLYYYQQTFGLEFTILRYANVYGPRQSPHGEAGVVAIFASLLLNGKQPIINGDGTQTRDFVYVKDVVRANCLALEYPESNYFNIGTGMETNINQLYHLMTRVLGLDLPEKHGPAKDGEQLRSVLTFNKTRRLLKWEPQVMLETGLAQTIAFFRESIK